jgi:hypothetical protein
MQPDSPYQVIRPLGSTPVGNVWSAVDGEGRPLTVAVLEAHVAADQRWRDAFVAAAHALPPQRDGRPYANADFASPTPWVTRLADGSLGAEHVFLALGMEYSPAAPPPVPQPPASPFPTGSPVGTSQPFSGPPQSANGQRYGQHYGTNQPSGANQPISSQPYGTNQPVSSQPYGMSDPMSGPPYPTSGPPQPISVVPEDNRPISDPMSQPYAADPFSSPVRRIEPSPPRPKRTGLWIALGVVLVVLLAGGGTFYFLTRGSDDDGKGGGTRTNAAQQQTQTSAAAPAVTPTPLHPGIEPPRVGNWPAKWPVFAAKDRAKKLTLDGVGFPVTVPLGWSCNPAANGADSVKYNCGITSGADQVGGELIVRDCAEPCDTAQQESMREREEAWGQAWRWAGKNATLAETLTVDGADRYGLVIVAYVPGSTGGHLGKQVVLRLTGPSQWRNDLRKVANGVRSAAKF